MSGSLSDNRYPVSNGERVEKNLSSVVTDSVEFSVTTSRYENSHVPTPPTTWKRLIRLMSARSTGFAPESTLYRCDTKTGLSVGRPDRRNTSSDSYTS